VRQQRANISMLTERALSRMRHFTSACSFFRVQICINATEDVEMLCFK
jgi:hypothetical protein